MWSEEIVFVEYAFAEAQMVVCEELPPIAAQHHADKGEIARKECVGVVVGHASGIGGRSERVNGVALTCGIIKALSSEAEHIFVV